MPISHILSLLALILLLSFGKLIWDFLRRGKMVRALQCMIASGADQLRDARAENARNFNLRQLATTKLFKARALLHWMDRRRREAREALDVAMSVQVETSAKLDESKALVSTAIGEISALSSKLNAADRYRRAAERIEHFDRALDAESVLTGERFELRTVDEANVAEREFVDLAELESALTAARALIKPRASSGTLHTPAAARRRGAGVKPGKKGAR